MSADEYSLLLAKKGVNMMSQKLLTIEDICAMLGVGKNTAYKIAKSVRHVKIGQRILVPEQELSAYIEKHLSTTESA